MGMIKNKTKDIVVTMPCQTNHVVPKRNRRFVHLNEVLPQ